MASKTRPAVGTKKTAKKVPTSRKPTGGAVNPPRGEKGDFLKITVTLGPGHLRADRHRGDAPEDEQGEGRAAQCGDPRGGRAVPAGAVGMSTMSELSKQDRIAIVISVIWPLVILFLFQPWSPDYSKYETAAILFSKTFAVGVLPLLLYWGYRFIAAAKGSSSDQSTTETPRPRGRGTTRRRVHSRAPSRESGDD